MKNRIIERMIDVEPEDSVVDALPGQPCTCGRVGYCPQHGTYEPPVTPDGEYVAYMPVRCRTRQGRVRLAIEAVY